MIPEYHVTDFNEGNCYEKVDDRKSKLIEIRGWAMGSQIFSNTPRKKNIKLKSSGELLKERGLSQNKPKDTEAQKKITYNSWLILCSETGTMLKF